ncbi:MAG: hypothetical protein IH987_18155, partial [Planctomycetes bacterium]|nr:hypothetical protein [Planctomycetota bacterium]
MGRVTQVIGSTLDAEFEEGHLPKQYNALQVNVERTVLGFTEKEEERGNKLLAEMGIGPKDRFVCFHTRDPAYLNVRRVTGKE